MKARKIFYKLSSVGIVLMVILFFTSLIIAVPLPPNGPFEISGKIVELKWYPEKAVKGIPGMSGSAGKDRKFPAHYIVQLTDYKGVDPQKAREISMYVDYSNSIKNDTSAVVTLMINHNNKRYLKKGMTILISGYNVRGDEGGIWTYYTSLNILKHNSTEEAIEHYLENHILKPEYGGETFCAYEIYGKELKQGKEFFYLWALCSEYYKKGGILNLGSAVSVPLVLVSRNIEAGSSIEEHKMPTNGEGWSEDVKRLIPKKYHNQIFAQGDAFSKRGNRLFNIAKNKAMCYYKLTQCSN